MKALCGIIIFGIIFCTSTEAQIIYGPQMNVQYSTSIGGYSYYKYFWDYGYKVGVFAQTPLKKNQWLRSELTLNLLEYKYQFTKNYSGGSDYVTGYLHAGYLQLPLIYERSFKNGFHFDGGGFAGFQITQHWNEITYHHSLDDTLFSGGAEESSRAITANRFQAGVTAMVGYLKSGFDLSIGSQYNLTSLFAMSEENYKKQHWFAVTLGLAYHIK